MKSLGLMLLLLALLAGGIFFAFSFLSDPEPPAARPEERRGSVTEPVRKPPEPVKPTFEPEREQQTAVVDVDQEPGLPVASVENPGSIVGRVVDPEGKPVESAQLELMRGPTLGIQIPGLRETTGAVLLSDASGQFRFEAVPPGDDYLVLATHPEFGDREAGPIIVRENEEVPLGEIRMHTGTIVKGLVAASGRPVEGAVMMLQDNMAGVLLNGSQKREEPVQMLTTTGTDGTYQFDSVPIKNFEVKVEAEGYGTMTKTSQTFFGGAAKEHEINFDLTVAASIAGSVVDENGRPVKDAEVKALITNSSFRCEEETRTSVDGRFQLDRLAEGNYFVQATAEGYSQGTQQRVPGGTLDVSIKLLPQGRVAGTVIDEVSGDPVTSFELTVMRYVSGRSPNRTKTSQTFRTTAGEFEVGGLDPNQYVLEGQAKGYAPSQSEPFQIKRGELVGGIIVAMNKGGSVQGVILDTNKQPVAGAIVALNDNNFKWNPVHELLQRMADVGGTKKQRQTDENGAFIMALVIPGTYQISVRHPDFAPLEKNDVVIEKNQQTELGRLSLSAGAVIEGKAYDEKGAPLAGATIQASSPEGDIIQARCDGQGHFRMAGVRPGSYNVNISSYQSDSGENPLVQIMKARHSQQEVSLRDGDFANLELRLQE